jgi:uncharacterized membrane protein
VAGTTSRRRLLARPSFGGIAVGLLFWWQSLVPTLMPRTWVAQAAVSAVCAGIGIVLGTAAGRLVHLVLERTGRQPAAPTRTLAWRGLAVAGAIVVVAGAVVWPRWQDEQRELVELGPIGAAAAIPMVLVAAVLLVVLTVLGRIGWRGILATDRLTSRLLPRPGAAVLTVLVVVLVGRFVATDVLFDRFEGRVRSAFGAVDDSTEDGVEQPVSRAVSGGAGSLVDWDDLGRQGRTFVAEATTTADLEAFHDGAVEEPVRVYVGLRSADDAEARAALAVAELERTGGFERSVLAVTTVTGTGWVDPDAAVALEQLHAGDTAMVAMQYSYLPSWISTLVDADVATEAGSALFDAVHEHWAALPEATRPKLVVFGQSLGSFGGEAPFAGVDARSSVANLVARTDGALFTGPTNGNLIWSQIIRARDPGSPVWRPVFDGGTSVRFSNQPEDLLDDDPSWEAPRILYVQHPSDPVTFWSADSLWSAPEWTDDPTGYDVPDRVRWFPIVTGVQGVADLAAGFGAPPGFGHDYRLAFVASWAAIAPPDGWTADDTVRLQDHLRG